MNYAKTNFELHDGTTCTLHVASGEVLSEASGEVATVSQDAGRIVPVGINKGIVVTAWAPGQISTKVHQRQSIWLRDAQGAEKQFNINAVAPLGVRPGHQASVVYCSSEQREGLFLAGAFNKTTGELRHENAAVLLGSVVPNPWRRQGAAVLLWLLVAVSVVIAACALAFTSDQSRQIAANRSPGCETVRVFSSPAEQAANKACTAQAWAEYRKAFAAQAAMPAHMSTKDKELYGVIGMYSAAALAAVSLLLVAMRRKSYRRNLQADFSKRLRDAVSAAVA